MNPIFWAFLACSFALASSAAEPVKPHLFQLRLVLDEPAVDSEQVTMTRTDENGQPVPVVLHVTKGALLDESDIKSAQWQADPVSGKPQVGVTFTIKAAKAFAEVTRTNLNRALAILIDGKVVSAPVIRTEIRDGKAVIDANFTQKQAEELAARINKAVQTSQRSKMKPWPHGLYDRLDR